MFWSLVKRIDQNKISSKEARAIYDQIFDDISEEQQEILEDKIAALEDEEDYWEITKRMTSKDYYEQSDDEALEDQLQEYDEYPFDDEEDTEPEE